MAACEFCGTIDQHSHLCAKVQQLLLQVGQLQKDLEYHERVCPSELANMNRLIDELREMVHLAVDAGGFSFHEEGCPEDDTCDCPDVKRANAAMGDFKSKGSKTSINLPTSEKRFCDDCNEPGDHMHLHGAYCSCKKCKG